MPNGDMCAHRCFRSEDRLLPGSSGSSMPKHARGRCSAPGLGSSPNAVGCTMPAGSVNPLAVPSTCAQSRER